MQSQRSRLASAASLPNTRRYSASTLRRSSGRKRSTSAIVTRRQSGLRGSQAGTNTTRRVACVILSGVQFPPDLSSGGNHRPGHHRLFNSGTHSSGLGLRLDEPNEAGDATGLAGSAAWLAAAAAGPDLGDTTAPPPGSLRWAPRAAVVAHRSRRSAVRRSRRKRLDSGAGQRSAAPLAPGSSGFFG